MNDIFSETSTIISNDINKELSYLISTLDEKLESVETESFLTESETKTTEQIISSLDLEIADTEIVNSKEENIYQIIDSMPTETIFSMNEENNNATFDDTL